MNVFKFELKQLYKQVIIWSVSLCSIFIIFTSMYPAYSQNKEAVAKVFDSYPPAVLTALGINIDTIFSVNGFYSFILTYLLLLSTIVSLYLSLSVFGRERKNKTSDFLLVKPISRKQIFLAKLSAATLTIVSINIIYLLISLIMFHQLKATNQTDFLLITLSMFIVEMIFFSLGVFLSIFLKKIKNIGNIANSVGFTFFIIGMVAGLLNKEWLNYFTPFKFFDLSYILQNHMLDIKYVIFSGVIIIGLIIFSYLNYIKRDIENLS